MTLFNAAVEQLFNAPVQQILVLLLNMEMLQFERTSTNTSHITSFTCMDSNIKNEFWFVRLRAFKEKLLYTCEHSDRGHVGGCQFRLCHFFIRQTNSMVALNGFQKLTVCMTGSRTTRLPHEGSTQGKAHVAIQRVQKHPREMIEV